jgi:isoleucyl-tRNA synthetase
MSNMPSNNQKSLAALREEAILAFWKERGIFEKTVAKNKGEKEFVFFEGPPTANAKPALHHLEARAFKDVIPRYKTMQGFYVPRRAGWDTHGLPVELQIEKSLGLTNKKDIETYGIAAFNKACKDSVFTYIKDWEVFTDRIGYWVDKGSAYYTFNPSYMEALWGIIGKVNDRGLLYKDYRVLPWCARCGTTLATHELAQGYMDIKDLTVYAKFPIKGFENAYFVAWTTTPWTLPGNVALAVGADIDYVEAKVGDEILVVAKDRLSVIGQEYEIVAEHKGGEMVGMEYTALYDVPTLKSEHSYKVYAADFVTTTDGTGIVHIAPMYGADDFALATKANLPKAHTVGEDGKFVVDIDFLRGRFVKDEEVAVDIIKDLAHRGLLFKKEKYEHSYPHCWRCKTPLIYYARDSWYIRMSELREDLITANNTINWEPDHIQQGRFGEWLREVKDWAISRERYWGTPLPIWQSEDGERIVVDSVATLKKYAKKSGNEYYVMRHGQTDHNVALTWNCDISKPDPLTELGHTQIEDAAREFDTDVDVIIASPFTRTQETARLFAQAKKWNIEVQTDDRLREWNVGARHDGEPLEAFFAARNASPDRYRYKDVDGESYIDVIKRAGAFLYDIEQKYAGKKIMIVTHGGVARALELVARGVDFTTLFETTREYTNFTNAEIRHVDFAPLPHNDEYELDLHRPYIDDVVLEKDGKEYKRVKEVMDVWFDSGSMPFAQDEPRSYPADFISEAIDQTRGWFYTLLAVSVLMERGTPYKNVICLGHLLDKDGKKMSKSIGNIVEPFEQMDKFGVDAVRYWMYSVNAPGESKNYDEKSVAEINNKVFNLLGNVYSFYELYRDKNLEGEYTESTNVLDQWIVSRLNLLVEFSTEKLNAYDLFRPTRQIQAFMENLSTLYLRRSRDRIKDGNNEARATLYHVLKTVAKVLAPFAPFCAEDLWQKLRNETDEESVHLTSWPTAGVIDQTLMEDMEKVREMFTEGNAIRKKEAIPVRQPLQSFSINIEGLEKYYDLIKDELNVKEIKIGEIGFDMTITPALKLEGDYRELVRVIQDMRKEKGLMPQDIVTLTLPTRYQEIIDTFGEELKKIVGAEEVVVSGEEISIQ